MSFKDEKTRCILGHDVPESAPLQQLTGGFLFLDGRTRVVLLEKTHPHWMKGMLWGPGGHSDPGETPLQCMHREYREETGIDGLLWELFARFKGPGYEVSLFVSEADTATPRSLTEEVVGIYDLTDIFSGAVLVAPRVKVLVAMAEYFLNSNGIATFEADYIREYNQTTEVPHHG